MDNRIVSARGRFLPAVAAAAIGTAPLHGATPARPAPAMSAATYNAIIAQVRNCDDFKAREPSLPRANPFLAKLVRKEWPTKGEFETTPAFNQRIKAEIARTAVDPDLVLLEVRLSGAYDADKQVLKVDSPAKYGYRGDGVQIASVTQSKKIDYGSDLYGPMAISSSGTTHEVRVNLNGFEDDAEITMPADQARQFKAHGRLVLFGSFQAPYIKSKSDYWSSKRLFGGNSQTYSTIFNFVAKCAVMRWTDKSQFPKLATANPPSVSGPATVAPVPKASISTVRDNNSVQQNGPVQPIVPPRPRNVPPGTPVPILPTSWVGGDDWPSAALREGRSGISGYSIDVGTDGLPVACAITASSGHADLDETTCTVLMRRARFHAAEDGKGNRIRSVYTGRMNWITE